MNLKDVINEKKPGYIPNFLEIVKEMEECTDKEMLDIIYKRMKKNEFFFIHYLIVFSMLYGLAKHNYWDKEISDIFFLHLGLLGGEEEYDELKEENSDIVEESKNFILNHKLIDGYWEKVTY